MFSRQLIEAAMHHLPDLHASTRPAPGSLLSGCDIRLRLIVALVAILMVLMSTRPWFPLTAATACVLGLKMSRVPLKVVVFRLAGPLVLAAVLCVLQMFVTGHTSLFAFGVGPWRLVATTEGFARGVLLAARVLGSVTIVMTACMGATATELFASMRWARMPRTGIEIAVLMYRYIFILFQHAVSVVSAQRVRLGYGNVRQSFRSLGNLAGIVMLRSLDQAEKSHEAMVARGYQGTLPLPGLRPLTKRQWAFAGGGSMFIGLAYLFVERGPW